MNIDRSDYGSVRGVTKNSMFDSSGKAFSVRNSSRATRVHGKYFFLNDKLPVKDYAISL